MKITKKKLKAIDDQIKAMLLMALSCIEFHEAFGEDRYYSELDNAIIHALSERAKLLVSQLSLTPFFKCVNDMYVNGGDDVFKKCKAIIMGQRVEGVFKSGVGTGGCVTVTATNVNGVPTDIVKSCPHPCGPSDFCEGGMCDRMGCYQKGGRNE